MITFLTFAITGDPAFDFFFSLPATLAIFYFIASAGITMMKGR